MMTQGRISWVGIQHGPDSTIGSINVLDLSTRKNDTYDLPERPGFAFATDRDGVFITGVGRSLGLFDTAAGKFEPLVDGIDSGVDNTIVNDGVIVGDNLVFGCKDLEFATKKAGLYLYRGRDQKLIQMRDDQICSNGKAVLSIDGDTVDLLDIDSPTKTIVRYKLDVASGTLSGGDVVVDFDGNDGVPDGMTVTPDRERLIVAIFNPDVAEHGETRMYDIDRGSLLHTWITPGSPQNTCPTLVQTDRGVDLVITTAVENMDSDAREHCPNAGRLFVARTPLTKVDPVTKWVLS